ncbi:MAG: hypothetical protein EOO44_19715 [Flavobacterium sp.]|jgi:hypothetical protein|nr:MAG: hypothetical protein EOO44_19715 [Flavobacterium sp.]
MEPNLNTIHIFKTNIKNLEQGCTMQETLNNHTAIQQWSIDHEDIDCVLRVVSETLEPKAIIAIINDLGHECQELN